METAFVEYTRERLLSMREEFEIRAEKFVAAYKQRRINYILENPGFVRSLWLRLWHYDVTWKAAETWFNRNRVEQHLLKTMQDEIDELRDLFSAASNQPLGARILLRADTARWFGGDPL